MWPCRTYSWATTPYLIVNNERFTKHYYAGTQRIASKVGSGDFYNVYGVNGFHLTAGQKDYEGDWFFFHTDHLGSTSYLTDTAGNVSQFVWYTPYGESLVDEHTNEIDGL